MHPIVNIAAANAGVLESPAFARKGLVPKVAIGSAYVPRQRESLNPHTGVYRGVNPAFDGDAHLMQAAFLKPALARIVPRKKRSRFAEACWWILGGALLASLAWLALIVGPAVGM